LAGRLIPLPLANLLMWWTEQEGYAYWTWQSESGPHQVHYVKVGDDTKPPIVLIHGFGASVFHWRYACWPNLFERFYVTWRSEISSLICVGIR
jgi:alpha-beta hydrolase superfamily lysophospholipase